MRLLTLALLAANLSIPASVAVSQPQEGSIEAVNDALEMAQAGRIDDAIALLEPLASREGAPEPLRAVLGALYLEASRPADALTLLQPMADQADADPAVLYNAGRAALASGQGTLGESYLERSAELAPGSPAARQLGLLRGNQGRLPEAFLLLRPWIAQNPHDNEARLAAAFCAVAMERAPVAEELLSDLPQDNPRVRMLWGKLLLLKGDPYGALSTLRPLLSEAPEDQQTDLKRALGQAYLMTGQSAEAIELLEGQVAGSPGTALQLSHAQFQSGDPEAALGTIEPFARAVLESPPDGGLGAELAGGILVEHGKLLAMLGRQEEAIPSLGPATLLVPDNKQAWQSLGQSLAAVGRREEAQAALERFKEITENEVPAAAKEMQLTRDAEDPTSKQLREVMLLIQKEQPEEALFLVRQEAELAPDDPRPRLVEARALLLMQRPEAALVAAEKAIEIAPDNPDGYYQRGMVKMIVGDDGAEADLRRALEIAPNHTPAMNDLAVLLMQEGRNEEARRLLENVLELNPNDEVARRNLARLAQSLGG